MTIWRVLYRLGGGNPVSAAGCLLFVCLVANQARLYGRQWEVGRYGMPRSLVSAADPGRYADNSPVDPLTRAAIAAGPGVEERVYLTLLLVAAGWAAGCVLYVWWVRRRRERAFVRALAAARAATRRPPTTPPRSDTA